MENFVFADGEELCLYADGEVKKLKSKFIESYKRNAENTERAKSWKHSGEGAQFRGDVRPGEDKLTFKTSINGIYSGGNDGETLYSFTINETSGVYKKNLLNEKEEEVHVINSLDNEFEGGVYDVESGNLTLSVRRNYCNTDLAVLNTKNGDLRTVTDGDTEDIDPYICPDNGNIIYFSSRGAGRGADGSFIRHSPAAVCKLDLGALTVDEIKSSDKHNYFKPVSFGGKLYALRTPYGEKRPNPIIEIILIPFRIIQAIANFVNAFVKMFTGKSLASGGSNPTKSREFDSRKEFVKGNLINYEKELKKNKKRGEGGMIPWSWEVIELESGEVLARGAADYDFLSDGTLIYTNGKHIFAIKDKNKRKLCDCDNCLKLSSRHQSSKCDADIFF